MRPLADNLPAPSSAFVRHSDADDIRRSTTLIGTHRVFPFTWGGKPAHLTFTPVASAPTPSGWLRVRLGEHAFDLGLPVLPEPATLGANFAGIEIAALPAQLQLGVLEAWLEDVIAALQRQNVVAQLEAWQTTAAPPAAACGWTVTWDGREQFLAGTLHADSAALDFLALLAERVAPSAASSGDALPFPVSLTLARVPLPLASLRALATGDVVFLPLGASDLSAGHCELWSNERCLGRAVRQPTNMKILSMNPSSEAKSAAATTASLAVDDLPVHLLFDLGQVEFSVGQLRTIAEGYTFPLPATAERLVTIRANGREIGRGELVEIGDKIGVRISNWSLA